MFGIYGSHSDCNMIVSLYEIVLVMVHVWVVELVRGLIMMISVLRKWWVLILKIKSFVRALEEVS